MAKGNRGTRVEKTSSEKAAIAAAKAAQFLKVAKPRVARALKSISLLENLSGAGYSYTPSQAKQITKALVLAINTLDNKLAKTSKGVAAFEFADESASEQTKTE